MRAADVYRDRREAGETLAARVREQLGLSDAVVLALPRGGVPVGFEVARGLDAPLDVFVVRKLGVPGHEEFAMGAIATGGVTVLNDAVINELGITPEQVNAVAARETGELRRREFSYRANRPAVDVAKRVALLVDDGLATGFTMRAAIAATREREPQRLVVAVPVGAADTCEEIAHEVDLLICPRQPEAFHAVGLWYEDFAATTDEEVRECLAAAAANYETTHHGHGS
jgi:predicted phosphoribosyltransferase